LTAPVGEWPALARTLLQLVSTQPALMADHADAYVKLVTAETRGAVSAWRYQALWRALALAGLMLTLALAGVALMLWAVSPVVTTLGARSLWLVPAVPLVLAGGCLWRSRMRSVPPAFAHLYQQLRADEQLLRELARHA
jgi:uncharacterized membrane protein YqjE